MNLLEVGEVSCLPSQIFGLYILFSTPLHGHPTLAHTLTCHIQLDTQWFQQDNEIQRVVCCKLTAEKHAVQITQHAVCYMVEHWGLGSRNRRDHHTPGWMKKQRNEIQKRIMRCYRGLTWRLKKCRDWKSVLYNVMCASVFKGTLNRDVIDYCYRWTGSYCNTDKGSHNTLLCNILLD